MAVARIDPARVMVLVRHGSEMIGLGRLKEGDRPSDSTREQDLPKGAHSGRNPRLADHLPASRRQAANLGRSREAEPSTTTPEAEVSQQSPVRAAIEAGNRRGRNPEIGLQAILFEGLAAMIARRSRRHFRHVLQQPVKTPSR